MTADAGRVHRVLDTDVTMPVEIRQARAFSVMYGISAAAAQRLIEPTGLQVLTTRPGRGMCALVFVDYIDGDLGPYNEFGVCILAGETGGDGGGLRAMFTGRAGALIHRLPVDGEFTLAAGRGIWGFPKTLAHFDTDHQGRTRAGAVGADGRLIAALHVRAGIPIPDRATAADTTMTAYSHLDGRTRATPWTLKVGGIRVRPGGARLQLGSHPIADEIRSLRPGRPLMSMTIDRFGATFGEAVALDAVPAGVASGTDPS